MCNYKSAIVLKDESVKGGFKLLLSPWTESHSELCQIYKLNDKASARLYFARVEYSPKDVTKPWELDGYKLRLDEERAPDWWNEHIAEDVAEKLRAHVETLIVNDEREILIGGHYIIGPKARIGLIKEAVIRGVAAGAHISDIRGGTISNISGGTISDISGGTISNISGGTISNISGGTISDISGGTISNIWGGTISNIRGGTISNIRGGTISNISGGTISNISGGTISDISGGTISDIWGGTISNIWGGTISNIRGGTISDISGGTISNIWGGTYQATIGNIGLNAIVHKNTLIKT
jgi:hypothetical protein